MGFMSRDKGDPLASTASPRKTWRKKVAIGLCAVVLAAGGYGAYRALTPKETTYLTMPVTRGRITDVVQASGTVKPLQEADLKFKNDGVLQSLPAKVGLNVTQGQQLAVQDDADLRTAVDQAANEVTQAEYKLRQSNIDLNKAKTTLNRQEALFKDGAISLSDIEQARIDYSNAVISRDMAEASIKSAQVKLQIAQNTLKDAVLSAPFSGVVSSVEGEVGQDSSIVAIHMISPQLQVVAQVNEADISRVKANQKVNLTLASESSKQVTGTVAQISPQAQTVNNIQLYEVSITVDNVDKLLMPGMSVTANIVASQSSGEHALVQNLAFTYAQTFARAAAAGSSGKTTAASSSKSQLQRGSGASRQGITQAAHGNTSSQTNQGTSGSRTTTKRVVVLENGQPVLKSVQTGLSDGTNTEVISGLQPGEKVVIGTSDSSSDNSSSNNSGSSSKSNRNQGGPGPMF